MKKTLALILIGVLLGASATFAASKLFSDVPADAWYSNSVSSLSEKGIIGGYPDGTFGPNKYVNRAELAVMMDRLIEYMENGEVAIVEIESDPVPSKLCTSEPTVTDIGSTIYPIDSKYSNLNFLGQLFTAYECGADRVGQLFGVNGDSYTLGSSISLLDYPSQNLIDAFDTIGFTCHDENINENCKSWQLWETVNVDDMMMLEPYYQEFAGDDCTTCG
ncbi:hypothetical protein GF354_04020 [Candidatus Peregrinibacteria bacterium]|nr:hypothetical protein [Candidatus Peregrinibacteria bacterium]